MGIFGDQAERLLRESWPNATELAEELYAIFTSTEPVQVDSPLQVTSPPNSTVPPLTLRNLGTSPTSISIKNTPAPAPQFPSLPPVPTGTPGTFTATNIYNDGSSEVWSSNLATPPAFDPITGAAIAGAPGTGDQVVAPATKGSGSGQKPSQASSGAFPGKVTGGSGSTYQVDVYLDGLLKPATNLTVTQFTIAADAVIPVGTATVVYQSGSGKTVSYWMQVPVWGPDVM